MQVFKFGGSSIRNAGGIRNLGEIVNGNQECKVVVISALGKTTNDLEDLLSFYFEENDYTKRKYIILERNFVISEKISSFWF